MPTKIEWTQESWNPLSGCTKISTGCRNCYAERMAKRLAGRFGYPEQPDHFKVTLHPDKLDQPYKWKKPRMIFVCSMGDLFHFDVPDDYIEEIVDVIIDNPQHIFQILTKRPSFIWPALFEDVPNVWLGVTAENQQAADERIPWLLKTPAAVRFVSVEPMLGPVDLKRINYKPGYHRNYLSYFNPTAERLDWVICGGETGPGARPMKAKWALDLSWDCAVAGVPFFFKKPGDAFQGDPLNLPQVRQFPNTRSPNS
jgi:protein gp37